MLLPVVLVVLESPVLPVVELPPAPPVVDSLLELAVEFPIPPIPVAATELEDDAELPPVVELAAPFVAELVEFDELEVEELAGPLLVSDALVAVPMVGPVGPALGPCAVKPLPVVVSLFGEVSTTVAQDAISSDVPTGPKRGTGRFDSKAQAAN